MRVRLIQRVALIAVILATAGCGYIWGKVTYLGSTYVPPFTIVVQPVYPTYNRWLDYIFVSVPANDVFSQPETPCTGAEAGLPTVCVHSGELRQAVLPSAFKTCQGLSAVDSASAFSWTCSVLNGVVTFRTKSLATGMGLKDVINSNGQSFKSLVLTVSRAGNVVALSLPSIWWPGNSFYPLPDNSAGAAYSLTGSPYSIFTLTQSRLSNGYNIGSNQIALVALNGATLSYAGSAALNCNSGNGTMGGPNKICLIATGAAKLSWIEGRFDAGAATKSDYGVLIGSTKHMTVRASVMTNHNIYGVVVAGGGTSNLFSQNTISGSGSEGFLSNSTSYNMIDGLTSGPNGSGGLSFDTIDHWTVKNVNLLNNGFHNFHFATSTFNKLYNFTVTGGANQCLYLLSDNNNIFYGFRVVNCPSAQSLDFFVNTQSTFVNMISANNNGSGFDFNGGGNITVAFATSVNNVGSGFNYNSSSVTLHNIIAINNASFGLNEQDNTTGGNIYSDNVYLQNLANGVRMWGTTANKFINTLMVGASSDCAISSAGTGLRNNGNCADSYAEGANTYTGEVSTATLRINRNLSSSFYGQAGADSANGSAGGVPQLGSAISDFFNFSNIYRTWGLAGAGFPAGAEQGNCAGSVLCSIWDWRLNHLDTVIVNKSFDGASTNPQFTTGANNCLPQLAQTMIDTRGVTYYTHAIEIIDDGIGNDDGLCEVGESCIYAPNFGAYQGEGDYTQSSCTIGTTTIYNYPSYGF